MTPTAAAATSESFVTAAVVNSRLGVKATVAALASAMGSRPGRRRSAKRYVQ
jgi:hypothetical protein